MEDGYFMRAELTLRVETSRHLKHAGRQFYHAGVRVFIQIALGEECSCNFYRG